MEFRLPQKIPTHYTDIIRAIFNERVTKNINYSLRAFARDLEMTPGHLSEIFTGKSNISLKKAESISAKLGLSSEDHKFFYQLVEISKASDEKKIQLERSLFNFDTSYLTISNDSYAAISEWSNLAFLEVMSLINFKNDPAWIANRLGITIEETQKIIENLKASGLIDLVDGKLTKNYDYYVLPKGNDAQKARDLHQNALKKASIALEEQDSETRDFSTTFFHVAKSDIPAVTEKIKNFRRELVREFESKKNADSVYLIGIQLFRADHDDRPALDN